jgi:hypothetical protein
MLFLVMDVLNNMFREANTWSVLQQLPPRQLPYRVSMYADDVVLFLSPSLQDLQLTTTISGVMITSFSWLMTCSPT